MADLLGPAANTLGEQEQELKRIQNIAQGRTDGIESIQYKQEAIDKLKSIKDKANEKAEKNKCYAGPIGYLAYAIANYRDAKYCQRGRKFMRIAALNAKSRIAYTRALALDEMERDTPT